ncbi:MAG TPA: MarR family transcriptional regulator [Chryseolinea sp.]|nr:MarR family transcriptional regulator [Chryseolinea sp.]HPM31598.1 MarR family transcriptional regulator [Chryseolinea sp.]
MALEKDIQQTDFRNEYQKGLLNICYTYYFLISHVNELFKKHDITRQQYNVLRILRGQHPNQVSVYSIRDRMLDKMSDASRIVERLRLKELVIRKSAEKDKRAAAVSISDQGLALLEAMEPETEIMDSLLSNLSEKEVQLLNTLLDKIRSGLSSLPNAEAKNEKDKAVEKIRTLASL